MKRLLIYLLACATGLVSLAQSDITALEYYIDDDPGVGLGTSVTITPGQTINANFTIPTSSMGLSNGVHILVLRTQNSDGDWGVFERRTFYIQADAGTPPTVEDITALEYYIDDDPGVGLATAIAVTPGQTINESLTIPTSSMGLSNGYHQLVIRAQNDNGDWSTHERRIFFIQEDAGTSPTIADISELEYFFDEDPGVGQGVSIAITPGQSININEIISSTGLSDGFHTINVRAKNTNDQWGLAEKRRVLVQNLDLGGSPADITALEYFIDNDPGVGAGVQIPITPATSLVDLTSIPFETGDTLTIGPHTLTVRAQDENGIWGHRETRSFTVDGDCPIAGFDVQNACVGQLIQLTDTSTGLMGSADYRWYADGQLISTLSSGVTHVFDNPGTHSFSLAIDNGVICTDSTGIEITVKAEPFAVFSAETVELGSPTLYEVETFNVDASYYWAWDFETDGTIDDTTAGATNYTFGSDGTYLTTLTITDSLGCSTSFARNVVVEAFTSGSSNPTASFTTLPVCEGSTSSFTDLSNAISAGATYSWDFDGDGIEDDATAGDTQFAFSTPGSYSTTLTIYTAEGDTLTYTEDVIVTQVPVADFSVGTTCVGEAVAFTDQSTVEAAASYSWDFDGDGLIDSTTVGDVSYVYSTPGNYAASLLVDNGNGCFDFIVQNVVIVDPPQADFAFSYSTFGNVASVVFENQSIDGVSYEWDFGDGGSSTDSNPSHEFIDYRDLVFDVCLTVTNGCSTTQYCESLALTVTGIQDLSSAGIDMYPNPSDGNINLDFRKAPKDAYKIEIYDMTGKRVKSEFLDTKMEFESHLSFQILVSGNYLMKIVSSKMSAQQKIIIN